MFILCSEVFSGLCAATQRRGTLSGLQVARGSPKINHLLFADDAMFFTRTNERSLAALKAVIQKYEETSGQTINPNKSTITFSDNAKGENVYEEPEILEAITTYFSGFSLQVHVHQWQQLRKLSLDASR